MIQPAMTMKEIEEANERRRAEIELAMRLTLKDTKPRKHSHYYKPSPFEHVDVYRLLKMYEVTDPCIQHAIKKLLAAGQRGAKDEAKDIQEAIDTLHRWQEMRAEDGLPRDRVACSELK